MVDPYIGKMLDNRYEILDVLGTGGMAVVYRAYCHRLNRYVAVKILKSELASDQDLKRRFHDESQSVAMLSHQNIVSVYDVNEIDGREFIVMELIDGITLKQYMYKRGGCLNWKEALHFITQIMQALKHAHSRGIIHRDIKPQNVMVLRDGSVKVTDFGIARSMNSQATMTQEAIGSVHYISPEQAKGSHVDARSDVYSAGIVLYEMLTGRLPYEGENAVSVAIQHINSIPVPPREHNPSIPLGMEQITLKAMASVLDRRYASADEMLKDLEEFRRNPDINFGYVALGVVEPDVAEPTMVHKGQKFVELDGEPDEDATVIEPVRTRAAPAHFERDEDTEADSETDTEEEDDKKNKRFIILLSSLVGALIIVLILLYFMLFRGLLNPKQAEVYTVPNLIGYSVSEAQDMINGSEELSGHFTINIGSYEPSDEYEIGVIIDQTPAADRSTRQDSTQITVTLSSGSEAEEEQTVTLEDYTNEDYRLVKNQLVDLGLSTTCTGEYSDEVEEGMVIRTDPVNGAVLNIGDTVTVYYSMGEAPAETMQMISVLNYKESDAKSALAMAGLTVGTVDSAYSDTYAEGYICYQSIPERTQVEKGTTVNLTVSLGPEPKEEPEEEPEVDDEDDEPMVVKRIIVTLPEGRETDSVVEITINGSILYRNTISVDNDEPISLDYDGSIITCSVTVDGQEYQGFSIEDIQY